MIPYGQEGMERIERHRRQREGKGFITLEAPFDICEAVEMLAADGSHDLKKMTLLIECVSNITANEMFERHTDRKETVIKVCEDIRRLSDKIHEPSAQNAFALPDENPMADHQNQSF